MSYLNIAGVSKTKLIQKSHDMIAAILNPADSFKTKHGIYRCDSCGRFSSRSPCKCGCAVVRLERLRKNIKGVK